MTLLYDGSWEGFLTAILETWIHHRPEWQIAPRSADWFDPPGPCQVLTTNASSAERVRSGLLRLAGSAALTNLYEAFLHRQPGKEALLARFVRHCVRYPHTVLQRLADEEVRETLRLARAVRAEAHRYLGLLRFRQIATGLYYAAFAPDHQVLPLLVAPFRDRLGAIDWMIHDCDRAQAACSQAGVIQIHTSVQRTGPLPETATEAEFQALWQAFYRIAAVPERLNPRLQQAKLPQKTWKYLTEQPAQTRTG